MTEQQVSIAVNRLLKDDLTVSFYGKETAFTRHDLYDYVVFNSELAQELSEININHMEEDAQTIKYELTEFWDKAAEKFIKNEPEIKRFIEGFSYD